MVITLIKTDISDELYCEREPKNSHDTSAVAVKNDTTMVVHVLRLISLIFLCISGEAAQLTVLYIDSRRYSADLP